MPVECAASAPSAERMALVREAAQRLYRALDRVDPAQRVAFALHAIEGLPLREVAEITESTLVATKSRVWRARREIEKRARRDPLLAVSSAGRRKSNEREATDRGRGWRRSRSNRCPTWPGSASSAVCSPAVRSADAEAPPSVPRAPPPPARSGWSAAAALGPPRWRCSCGRATQAAPSGDRRSAAEAAPRPPSRIVTADSPSSVSVGDVALDVAARSALLVNGDDEGSVLVVLERGEVDFRVAPRAARPPVVVHAGDARIEVVGTAFTVTRVGDSARVAVHEGAVEVMAHGRRARVAAGQTWSAGALVHPAAPEPHQRAERDRATTARGRARSGVTGGRASIDPTRVRTRGRAHRRKSPPARRRRQSTSRRCTSELRAWRHLGRAPRSPSTTSSPPGAGRGQRMHSLHRRGSSSSWAIATAQAGSFAPTFPPPARRQRRGCAPAPRSDSLTGHADRAPRSRCVDGSAADPPALPGRGMGRGRCRRAHDRGRALSTHGPAGDGSGTEADDGDRGRRRRRHRPRRLSRVAAHGAVRGRPRSGRPAHRSPSSCSATRWCSALPARAAARPGHRRVGDRRPGAGRHRRRGHRQRDPARLPSCRATTGSP